MWEGPHGEGAQAAVLSEVPTWVTASQAWGPQPYNRKELNSASHPRALGNDAFPRAFSENPAVLTSGSGSARPSAGDPVQLPWTSARLELQEGNLVQC